MPDDQDDSDDQPRCPYCDTPISSVSVSGPESATLAPCGHEVSTDHPVLDKLGGDSDE